MNLDGHILEINEESQVVIVKAYHDYKDEYCLGELYLSKEQQKILKKTIKECKK